MLGVLLPTTGPGATLFGEGMVDAVEIATEQINAAGGVIGSDVMLINADEGATAASAAIGLDSLITGGVSTIIGPASSIVALSDLDAPVAAGIVTCSPTASALALDDYPDNGLFFRTIPSDSLQMVAMAHVAERTGSTSIAIGYLDDPYGRGLAEALRSAVAPAACRYSLRSRSVVTTNSSARRLPSCSPTHRTSSPSSAMQVTARGCSMRSPRRREMPTRPSSS